MSALVKLSLAEARKKLLNHEISAVELTQAHLSQINKIRSLNAYITETSELALSQAKASDERIRQKQAGRLEGIPLSIKDLFCTKDIRTTAGSKMLENFIPPYESTVTVRLWDAGAVMLGKLNLDQFGMGSSNLNSYFGPVENPWQRKQDPTPLVPGGSSGGSAAAVAAFAAMGATATDTGGSIRQPAAFCGLVGIKPTYGRCSRYGIIAFASSLDQAGFVTRTVRDAAILLEAVVGHDPKDATSLSQPSVSFEASLTGNMKGLRVGIPKEYHAEGLSADTERLWEQGIEWCKQAGAEIIDVSLPHTSYALPTYYILAPAEASSNLARYDGIRYGLRAPGATLEELYEQTRAQGFGDEVKSRILIGAYVLSAGYYEAYYRKAQKVRARITQDFKEAFTKVDVLLTPTTPTAAFPINDPPRNPITMYMNDVLTVPVSLAGLPALSLPVGLSNEGLPLGLQLIGPALSEETLFRAAGVLEEAANFKAYLSHMRFA